MGLNVFDYLLNVHLLKFVIIHLKYLDVLFQLHQIKQRNMVYVLQNLLIDPHLHTQYIQAVIQLNEIH